MGDEWALHPKAPPPQCHQAEGPTGTGDLPKITEERGEQGRGSPKVPSPALPGSCTPTRMELGRRGWSLGREWCGCSSSHNSAVTIQGDLGGSMTPWMCWRSWFQLESSMWPPQPHVHPPSSSRGQFCATKEEKQREPREDPQELLTLHSSSWGKQPGAGLTGALHAPRQERNGQKTWQ